MKKDEQAGLKMIERYILPILFGMITMLFLSQILFSMPMTGTSGNIPLANRPFPQHETYAAGTIRPTNFTQAEQDQHVRDFYDYWKSSYVVSAGNNGAGQPMYRVSFGSTAPDTTVSEGQGYGMVTVALMAGHDADAQAVFDGLWRFARNYPSGIDSRLMSWKIQNGQIVGGNDSAFDGDVDIAYGLLLADAQWGSAGDIDYKAEADTVIAGILDSTIGADSRLPKLGDWTSDNGSPYSQYTPRSSDFMPSHFRAFARATNDTTWETVISNSQAVIDQIQANQSATTGLLPDFIINCNPVSSCTPANSGFLEGSHDGYYYYNAGRDPWRMGLDALLNGDATSKDQVDKMVSWVNSNSGGSASNIKAGYQLDGSAIGNYFTTFFVAPFGVGAMLDSSQQSFLNDIYASVYNKREDYYEDSVNMLALLAMTGNYWDPTSNYTPPPTNTPGPSPTASNTPLPSNTLTPSLTPVGGPCAVDYTITSEWDVGFTGNVKITNNDSSAINGWSLTWTHAAGQQVTSPWNATVSQTGNNVTASNPADHWNGTIAANGGSVEFGFNGSHTGSAVVPTDFLLNGLACNGGGAAPTATSTATSGPSPTASNTPTVTSTATSGPSPTASNTPLPGERQVVAYFTQWGIYDGRDFHVKNIVDSGAAAKVDVINYAFGNIVNGECVMVTQSGVMDAWADYQNIYTAANSVDGVADSWNQPLRGHFNQLRKLKAANPNLKVLISLGGWTWSKGFSDAALTPQSRALAASSCIDIYIKGNLPLADNAGGQGVAAGIFDGIDIDWEYPGVTTDANPNARPEDKQNFTLLLEEFRKQLDEIDPNLLLTIAGPAGQDKYEKIELDQIHQHLDWINLMSYDYHGSWDAKTNIMAPLYPSPNDPSGPPANSYSVDTTVQAYLTAGIPANKLFMGIPLYGRGWTGVSNANDGLYQSATGAAPSSYPDDPGYEDYKVLKNKGYPSFRDPITKGFWIFNGNTFWSYDDPVVIEEKMTYLKNNGLGGAMLWEFSTDDDQATLLNTVYTHLNAAVSTPTATPIASPTPTTTASATETASATATGTATGTATATATASATATGTLTATGTATGTATATATASATATPITSPTVSATPTASNTPPPGSQSCAVDYTINQWNTGFTANVVINNETGAEIDGWTLTWSFPGNQQISSLWNGQHSQNGQQVTVSNMSYNGVIANGGTQNFGFQATYSGPNGAPTDFVLNGIPCDGPAPTPTPVPPTGPLCSVEYVINSDWGVGFVADVEITNNSGSDWQDWTLIWDFPGNQQVTNLWNGSHSQNGSQVTAQNASWNGNVLYGNTVNFGFQGSYSGNNELPTSFTVNGIDCDTINAADPSTPEANAPNINELLPNQGQNDLPNEINLFGSNLQADSSVSLNLGSQRRTNVPLEHTFISANQLRVVIPAGLLAQTYDMIVSNPDGTQGTFPKAYIVSDAPQDDLLSYDTQLWSVPAALHAGDEAQIGLHLYRQGGTETLSSVKVNFYLRDASASEQFIGSGQVPLLAPESKSHTTAVNWTVPAAGDYTLIAIIDEANDISEADESNNVLMRDITIMAAAEDVTPPNVDSFMINDGATETAQQDIQLSISASDPTGATPSSDVEAVFIIEYEFNQSLKQWIPANLSEWLPYGASTHNWTLLPSPGMKYLQVWARDGAGNISLASRSAMINYVPTSATLATGLSHFYAYHLSAGQSITAAITPTSGDPDLYIWSANGAENVFSINGEGEVDQAIFTARADGTYLIQVHAYQRAQYSLSVTIGNSEARSHRNQQVQGKTPLSAPRLAPTDLPQDLTYALPSTPTTGGNEIYLPLLVR